MKATCTSLQTYLREAVTIDIGEWPWFNLDVLSAGWNLSGYQKVFDRELQQRGRQRQEKNCGYFATIPSSSHYLIFAKYTTTGLEGAPSK